MDCSATPNDPPEVVQSLGQVAANARSATGFKDGIGCEFEARAVLGAADVGSGGWSAIAREMPCAITEPPSVCANAQTEGKGR